MFIKIGNNIIDAECFSDFSYAYDNDNIHRIYCTYKINNDDCFVIECKSKKHATRLLKNVFKQINDRREKLLELKNMIEYAPGSEKYEKFKSHFESLV